MAPCSAGTYDKIGNRLTEDADVYTYLLNGGSNNTPKLSSIALGAGGTRNYAYDAIGDTTSIGGTTLSYNQAKRLQQIGTDLTFLYDGRDFLRLSTKNPGSNTAAPTYSSEGLLHHRRDVRSSGTITSDYYVFHFAGRPVVSLEKVVNAGTPSSTLLYLTTDHLGTPALAADGAGAKVWEGGFEPFGEDYSGAQAAGIYLRFPGQWQDGNWYGYSGNFDLAENVYRWYEAGTGRYTRPDPLGPQGDSHVYLYVSANPLLFVDPTGERARTCCAPVPYAPGPAKHCFIQYQDEGTGRNTTYALHRVKGKGCTYRNDGFDIGSIDESSTACGPWNEECDKSCLEREFESYPNPSDYQLLRGPNSNAFARTLTEACGITPPSITSELGQTPGWNSSGRPAKDPNFQCPPRR